MVRKTLNTLMVNDDDLLCDPKHALTLSDLKLTNINPELGELDSFDLIVYVGRKGTKVLKSRVFRTGKVL